MRDNRSVQSLFGPLPEPLDPQRAKKIKWFTVAMYILAAASFSMIAAEFVLKSSPRWLLSAMAVTTGVAGCFSGEVYRLRSKPLKRVHSQL